MTGATPTDMVFKVRTLKGIDIDTLKLRKVNSRTEEIRLPEGAPS